MPEPEPDDDAHSPVTSRVILAVVASVLLFGAVNLVCGWLTWFLAALAVLVGCIAMCPPFRSPN